MSFIRQIKYAFFPLLITLFSTFGIYAAGEVDLGFNASAQFALKGPVHKIAAQSDGKLLVGGTFTALNGYSVNSLIRLNTDGTIDTSFSAPGFFNALNVDSVAVQSDGKILAGTSSTGTNETLYRLNADGSLDTTFTPAAFISNFIYDIKIQTDGKILASATLGNNQETRTLIRLNPDGTRDTTFVTTVRNFVREIKIAPDGKILIVGSGTNLQGFVRRLNPDGSDDSTFANIEQLDAPVEDIDLQSDGKIIFSGAFTSVNGLAKKGIVRINSDGTNDNSFNPSGTGADGSVNDIIFTADGKILIGGTFSQYNDVAHPKVARLNADGSPDPSFSTSLSNDYKITTIGFLADNKILVGYFGGLQFPNLFNGMTALNSNGSTDSTLIYNTSKSAIIRKLLEQPDGKLIVGGNFDLINNTPRVDIARLNSDGTLDPAFVSGIGDDNISTMALQPDGRILVGLISNANKLRRLNPDGSVDASFNMSLSAHEIDDLAVLPNGKILVGGLFNGGLPGLVRLNSDGSRDNTFGYNDTSVTYKIFVESDGRILVGNIRGIRRITADGIVDGTFNTNTGFVFDIAKQSDGKVIAVGSFFSVNNIARANIVRLTSEGVVDTTFTAGTDAYILSVGMQSDGKIVIGGQFAYVNGAFRTGLARLNADGTVDDTFTAKANDVVNDIILSNNKILVSGVFTRISETSKLTIVRLNNNLIPPRAPFDFDGDGRTDIVVYRPSNNIWYQLLGQNYQFSSVTFGLSDDVLAPADYDGDGKTDLGIFRPSTGAWWYRSTAEGNAFRAVQFGQSGDVPMPSDADGDGKADFVVYRPSNNAWYRLTSTGQTTSFGFGIAGDKPVIGDFDGDGKSDYAVYRPSTGVWWYTFSSQNNAVRASQFGLAEDIPVAADYDGDGKTDIAVFRASNGGWYILNSSTGTITILGFGIAGDKPAAGDYDGDGKADIAVYRPSTGVWYALRSSGGFTGIQLGASTDIPIPNAFIKQ